MKVLITGASGFVGQNLKAYLGNEFDLSAIKLRFGEKKDINVSAECIIHLSGKAHDLKSESKVSDYFEANYELTRQIYDAFLLSDAKKFIFISSVKAAADQTEKILTEDVIASPTTPYGRSKLMAEQYIRSQPLPDGKSYYILRPCMIHGPGNKGNLNLLYKFISSGIPYPLAAFHNKRSFLSIENLCFVIKELMLKNVIDSGIYHIADDDALSTNQVVKLLATALNKKVKFWKISKKAIIYLTRIGDRLKLPINSFSLQKLTENYVVSNKKIKSSLAIELPVKAKDGLLVTAKSFK